MSNNETFILDIELTNKCNANCIMCPRDKMSRPVGFMTNIILKQVVQKLNETKATHAVFSGFGEPTLHPDLTKFVHSISTQTNCYTQINSNGILLIPNLIDQLAKTKLDAINLNINAINEEDYKKINPGKHHFSTLMSNIDYIMNQKRKGWNISLKIQASILDETSDEAKSFYEFWFNMGIDEIIVHPCNNRGGYYAGKHQDQKRTEKSTSTYCDVMLFVAWNGDIFSCSHDIEGRFKLGDLEELQSNWLNKSKIPLCDTCNISSFKILKPPSTLKIKQNNEL